MGAYFSIQQMHRTNIENQEMPWYTFYIKWGVIMIRIAVVEDEPATSEQLSEYAERICREVGLDVEIVKFSDGIEITENYRAVWDIIFMDIEMPYLDGMSAAQRIRKFDPAVVLIFITNMARFAIKGYEVDAMDFVLKPVKYALLTLKLKKAVNIVSQHKRHYLLVSADGEDKRVSIDDIFVYQGHQPPASHPYDAGGVCSQRFTPGDRKAAFWAAFRAKQSQLHGGSSKRHGPAQRQCPGIRP